MLWAFIIIAGCNIGDTVNNNNNNKIFRYNEAKTITSFDPAFAKHKANIWVVNQLYNGLVQMDKHLKIIPSIAKSWEISENGLVYTFHLRDDVYFHNDGLFGKEKSRVVVANDFVYSFNRIIDPATASPGAWIFNEKLDVTAPFVAKDERTFIINLAKPFAPFLGILTMQYCSVVPKEVVNHYGTNFRKHPIGTGPFQLKTWEEGEVLYLIRNDHYFEKSDGKRLPYLDGVKITFMQEKNMEFLKLIQDELDFVSGIDGKTVKDDILTKKGDLNQDLKDKIMLIKSPFLNTEYFGFLTDPLNPKMKDSPLLIKEVRQAFNYSIDREKMISFLRNNISRPADGGFIPKGLPSYDPHKVKGYDYNPAKAKTLLKNAGFPNGDGFPVIILYTTATNLDICTFVQNQLKVIGIDVEIEPIQSATLLGMTSKYEAPFFRGNWIADYPDEESFLAMFYSKNPAPPNYTHFSNAAFDSLYNLSISLNNPEDRKELHQAMDRIIIEEAPVLFLYYDEVLRFIQKRVSGLENNPLDLLVLKNVRLTH